MSRSRGVSRACEHNLVRHPAFADNVRRHRMAPRNPAAGRLQNPRDELERAIQRAERGLAGTSAEGFREVSRRMRQAVLDSERLVTVLGRLAHQGLRRRGSTELLSPAEVQDPIQAVRAAVGRLANTTPSKLSSDHDEYNRRVQALIKVGRAVLERGLEPVTVGELDEWGPFREP